MTEVLLCDRRTIFIKNKSFIFYLLFAIVSTIPSSLGNGINPSANSPGLGNPNDGVIKRSGRVAISNESGSKFSNVLLKNSPFQSSLKASDSSPNLMKANLAKQPETLPKNELSSSVAPKTGDSLWGVITTNIFKQKNPEPNSSRNSVFSAPRLKSPRQAWEDLVINAKSGFKNRNYPFHFPKTEGASGQKSTITGKSDDDAKRTTRGSPYWYFDAPALAFDTAKVLWDVHKDLLHSAVQHNTVGHEVLHKEVGLLSPLKNALFGHIHDTVAYKDGVNQVYKNKFKDLAYHTFLHKEHKANKAANFGISGWLKSSLIGNGWAPPVPVHSVVAQPVVISDASLIKRWAIAKYQFNKDLFIKSWVITLDIIRSLPFLTKIKVKLLHTMLLLIHDHHFNSLFHLTKILHIYAWEETKKVLRYLLKCDKPVYGLAHLPDPTCGFGLDWLPALYHPLRPSPPKYGPAESQKYGSPPVVQEYKITTELDNPPRPYYGSPSAVGQEYKAPTESQQYGSPAVSQGYKVPEPIETKDPLYSYPSLYSPPGENQHPSKYATLPAVYRQDKGQLVDVPSYTVYKSSSYGDSVGAGSEKSNREESTVLAKAPDNPTKDKKTDDKSDPTSAPSTVQGPRFSLKLLGSGFGSR